MLTRRLIAFGALALVVTGPPLASRPSAEPRLRIAITPVLVEHYLEVNRQLVTWGWR